MAEFSFKLNRKLCHYPVNALFRQIRIISFPLIVNTIWEYRHGSELHFIYPTDIGSAIINAAMQIVTVRGLKNVYQLLISFPHASKEGLANKLLLYPGMI